MAADPYRYFRLEARELLDQFGEAVLELERSDSGGPQVQRLLRLAHTLKGAARVVKQNEIADSAHAIEEDLSPFRESTTAVPRPQIEAVLRHIDEIGDRVGALTAVEPAEPAAEAPTVVEENIRTVRADLAEMDAFLEGVTEVHALLNALRPAGRAMEQGQHLADLLLQQLGARGGVDLTGPGAGLARRAYSTAEELRKSLNGLERGLTSAIDQMDRELRQLRAAAEQLRLVSAGTLFTTLERTARDAARTLGKQVTFEGVGGGIRLDAYVLATVQSALVQIIRNAVAHGIEAESERAAAGKPTVGKISVNVSRRGKRIVFACWDDGRGMDLDAVRRVAVRRGLSEAEAARLGADDLIRLLLRGGISTAESVTGVSGRGVGLDVVREAVERLSGEVIFRTQAGEGVRFELVVPLSLAALETLVVEVDGTAVAIPFDAVRSSLQIAGGEITRTATGATIVFDQMAIPFFPLPKALRGVQSPANRNWPVVVVGGASGLAAVGVDRLLGSDRIVMRPLPDRSPTHPIVAGASLDAEGNPQLVLDPDGLVAEAQRGDADFEQAPMRRPLLVVDDSLTTRMLEQSILESAGYDVETATSGEEGLETARRALPALILVDVEMPGIDGFTFVERIRLDPLLRDTPAILVTSRNAPEDRQRGHDAGAQGYIVKSQFNQAELLATIRQLIG